MSKIALTMATRLQAKEMKTKGVLINSMCPGQVQTDMSSQKASERASACFVLMCSSAHFARNDRESGQADTG